MAKDIGEAQFADEVVERSREIPVVVDFWAEWCGPCRTLGPALEAAVAKRDGDVELVKVDVDANQSLAASFGIRGIPAVKAFRDGQVADEFTGAIPPAHIEAFLDRLVPPAAERLTEAGDEDSLREALRLDPNHSGAAVKLAQILIPRGETDEALALLDRFPGDFLAAGLAARARLKAASSNGSEGSDDSLAAALAAADEGDHEAALEGLHEALGAADDPARRDLIRQAMVGIFTELGADHPLAREHRRRLAAALN